MTRSLVFGFVVVLGSVIPAAGASASGCYTEVGTSGDDYLVGTHPDSGDCIYGMGGNDTIIGSGGYDYLDGGTGDDYIDGGGGRDTLQYAQATKGVHVDLRSGVATGRGTDTVVHVEDVEATRFRDMIAGSDRPNQLSAYEGKDVIAGRGGDDYLDAGPGGDRVDGGSGEDFIFYLDATQGVTVDLRSGIATGMGRDTIARIEDVYGSEFADVLDGDAGPNVLSADSGDDQLRGHDGDDTLFGSSGNDILSPGMGSDTVEGDDGHDTVDYSLEAPGSLFVSLRYGNTTGLGKYDYLDGIERANGSVFDDTIEGTNGHNVLRGMEGNDHLFGFVGDDILDGGAGNDDLDGGAGYDACIQGLGSGGRIRCEA